MRIALFALLCASNALAEEVATHVLQPRPAEYAGKLELLAFPAMVQVNGAYTQHFGSGLGLAWHPQESFAVQVSGFLNLVSQESAFAGELLFKAKDEAQASRTLLNTWGALLTAEVTPVHGKLALLENNLVHFSLLVFGGAGLGGTRHQLKPANASGPATYGDTGIRPLGSIGAGLRVQVGKRFSVRLELRDLVYSAHVASVNGCSQDDLQTLYASRLLIQDNRPTKPFSPQCLVQTFEAPPGSRTSTDPAIALNLVKGSSGGLLHNFGVQLGAGFLF